MQRQPCTNGEIMNAMIMLGQLFLSTAARF